MHQCVKHEIKFLTWRKKSRRERREEACCSVCRVLFCCPKDREKHEDEKHGREIARTARQQLQLLTENKPLACLSCCHVFVSGLFVTDQCNNVSSSPGTGFKAAGTTHTLIAIPQWAIEKYFFPSHRKRSWTKANEDDDAVHIVVDRFADKYAEETTPVQDNSFTQKTSIQSILTKQRKTNLSLKRDRRVTFSPVTAVAITSRLSIIMVGSQKTGGESSGDPTPTLPSTPPLPTPSDPSMQDLCSTHSINLIASTPAETQQNTDIVCKFPPLGTNRDGKISALSLFDQDVSGSSENCIFSPPLPSEGTDGSPMMTPQMSSTPVNENSERRLASMPEISSEQTTFEGGGSNGEVFSSLANIICCAFQALPTVLTQFFSSVYETDRNDGSRKEASGRLQRRQRRRSATFTPYSTVSNKSRQLHRRVHRQPLFPRQQNE